MKKFEILSVIGTIIFGSLLHFLFEWSGSFKPLALIAAVNESTWEHLKLAFWPAFIFAVIAYFVIKNKPANFCFAQAVKLISMPILIVVLFYGWLLFFPDNFIYDISIFVVAALVGHYLSYRIEIQEKDYKLEKLAIVLIIIALLKFSLFTYFTPKIFLFHNPVSGGYGIVQKSD